MSFKLNIKKALCHLSDKVKCVDMHSKHPWILSSLYTGHAQIYNYETQTTVKSFEVSKHHLRAGIFIPNKNWIAVGGDDKNLRIFNYNTLEKLDELEAHSDFVRSIAAHHTQKLLLTGSDDYTIRLWSYDDKGKVTKKKEFTGHQNFVMKVLFHPTQANKFGSCSIDTTIKIWNLSADKANLTLKGHNSGVNGFDFHPTGEPFLASASDDRTIKIWDLQQRKCVSTLTDHEDTVISVAYHPEMPYLLSASEDGNVIVWNLNNHKAQQVINYYLQKAWDVKVNHYNSKMIGIAYDEGTVVVKFGGDEPKASLSKGKLIFAKNYDIFSSNLKAIPKNELIDGAVLDLKKKELQRTDIYPLIVKHSPSGLKVVVTDNNEYVIYKAQNFKNLSFGTGTNFVWSNTNGYAAHKNGSVEVYNKNDSQITSIETDYPVEDLYGGKLLGIHSSDFVLFYNWTSSNLIQKVEITPKEVIWSLDQNLLTITSKDSFFMLSYNEKKVEAALAELNDDEELEDGVDDCFDVVSEIQEVVKSGIWINKVFFFLNNFNKFNYIAKDKVFNYSFVENASVILGLVKNQGRLYINDKKNNVISIELPKEFADAITAILDDNSTGLTKALKKLKDNQVNRVARYLEGIDNLDQAFEIVKNPSIKFDYAVRLGNIKAASELATLNPSPRRWKLIGDLSLKSGDFDEAEECFKQAKDYSSLFLLYSSLGYKEGLEWLAQETFKFKFYSVAFNSYFLLRDVKNSLECLVSSKKFPEAAFFAKTYIPSEISRIVVLWKESLTKVNPVIAQTIADPMEYEDEDQFKDLFLAEKIEKSIRKKMMADIPASDYQQFETKLDNDLFKLAKEEGINAVEALTFGVEEGGEDNKEVEELESPEEDGSEVDEEEVEIEESGDDEEEEETD